MAGKCLVVVLLAAVVSVAPGTAGPASAIAHGESAPDGAFPFSVLLTMTGLPTADHGTRDSSCSGALIAPRWVITAGHCFRDAAGRRVSRPVAARTTATVGRADLTSRAGHQADVVAVHQAGNADVALAEIGTAVTDITPLRIGTAPPTVGEIVRLTGYGLTAGADDATTERLQTGQFTVESVGDSLIGTAGRAPRPDTSPCPHDSGGAYFRQQAGRAVLVAVVSTGPTCPHPGPDLSARTDNLSDWIAETIDPADSGIPQWVLIGVGSLILLMAMCGAIIAVRRRP